VETELCELKESAGVPGFDAGEAGPLLADLADRYRETAAARDEVGALRRAVEAWPARRAELERELASVQREHAELLDLAGVSVSEEFRRVAGREEERRAYSDELQELRRTANDLSGPDGREIEEQFRSVSVEEASAELAGLRDRARDLEELRVRLRLRLAEVEQQLERLSGPPRTVDIRIEMDRIADEGRDHARAWVVRALAERLAGEAVQEFRCERQPERLRLAGEYLERLSGGRYVAVRPCSGSQPVGPDALEIVGSNGRPISLARLARAGIEQACLAVRLAAAHDRATRQETLPVILDDVPAHLGPDLAPGGVAAVTTLAGTTQVFLLTGRASTAELMRGARGVGRLKVIDIGAEGRQLPLSA
jgi:uncharacterized protein YhaN